MAYEQMKPQTQKWLDSLIAPEYDIDSASVWFDQLTLVADKHYKKWHYINLPFGDEQYFPKLDPENALTAIQKAKHIIQDPKSDKASKQFAAKVLLHVIADVHQPMHTVSYYSKKFPYGDKGGNLWRLKYGSLHQFWDSAGGFLKGFSRNDADMVAFKKSKLVISTCDLKMFELDPEQWIKFSHQLAVEYAYFPPRNKYKWHDYQQRTQDICKHQMQQAAINMAATFDALAPK